MDICGSRVGFVPARELQLPLFLRKIDKIVGTEMQKRGHENCKKTENMVPTKNPEKLLKLPIFGCFWTTFPLLWLKDHFSESKSGPYDYTNRDVLWNFVAFLA